MSNSREEAIGLGRAGYGYLQLSFLLLFPISFLLILVMAKAAAIVVEVVEAAPLVSFPLASEEATAM